MRALAFCVSVNGRNIVRTKNYYYFTALLAIAAVALGFGLVQCGTDSDEEVTLATTAWSYEARWTGPTTTTTTTTVAPVTTQAPRARATVPAVERPQSYTSDGDQATADTQRSGYTASWFATGPNGYYAAIGAGSAFGRGDRLLVCHGDSCIGVTVNDFCVGCGAFKLDLSGEAFDALASRSTGIINVTVAAA